MPENPRNQNADWNADATPQADQDRGDRGGDGATNHQPDPSGKQEGRDRPPAAANRRRSPWLGGG
jgi:hypothetical protein